MEHTEILTSQELSKRLKVSPATIRLWARRGTIPRIRVSAKVIRFDWQAVVRALAATKGNGGAS